MQNMQSMVAFRYYVQFQDLEGDSSIGDVARIPDEGDAAGYSHCIGRISRKSRSAGEERRRPAMNTLFTISEMTAKTQEA